MLGEKYIYMKSQKKKKWKRIERFLQIILELLFFFRLINNQRLMKTNFKN